MQLNPLSRALAGAGILVTIGLALSACGGGSDAPSYKPIELNIAHINDHHSQLDAFAATELTLDGVATQVELGGFARQAAMFKSVAGTKNLIKLHAGDALTGSLYYTFFKGAVDAKMMNTLSELSGILERIKTDSKVIDGGWFEIKATTPQGPTGRMGGYMLLARREADNSWKIHWSITNVGPAPAPAGAPAK